MPFLNYIQSIIPVSENLKEAFHNITLYKTVKKGQLVIRAGEYCHDIYFVESGLLRGYYFLEEREVTNWFAREGELATSFYSFVTKGPSAETIEALEDCELVQVPFARLQQLYIDFPETERLGRILTESYYIKLEGRLLGLQFTSAKERYDKLLQNNHQLVQRAPLGQIASYLGITQETLSRIRAKP
jgi:CRP-like cAMP-binding protein